MPDKKPILDYDDPNREIDSDEAWARMGQPTGRKRLSFWWLFLLSAVIFFVLLTMMILWHVSTGTPPGP